MANWGAAGSGAAAGAAAGSTLGPWGAAAGGVVGGAMGLLSGNQVDDQKKLSEQQYEYNKKLMEQSYGLQKDMYDYTFSKNTPAEQMKRLKEAGLNPALMQGLGGQSGADTGGGGTSVGGGQASGNAERQAATAQSAGMVLQAARLKGELDLQKAQKENIEADTENKKSKTTTENDQRETLIENMRQEGLGRWIDNMQKKWQSREGDNQRQGEVYENEKLGEIYQIHENSYLADGMSAALIKTQAEGGNQAAQALMNNEKAKTIFGELQAKMIQAQASKKQAENGETIALAMKLAAEFDTGEFTNWKTWTQLGMDGVNAIGNILGKVSPKGLVNTVTGGK